MATRTNSGNESQTERRIDWTDLKYAVFVGVVFVAVKLAGVMAPAWEVRRITIDDVASVLTLGYIVARARRQPERLDDWGITTRLTLSGVLTGAALLLLAVAIPAALGVAVAGRLSFRPSYVSEMIEYIPSAFPQQFFLCSVVLATLATLRPFRGLWQLPLAVGLLFSLAHFWTPARIPGTIVPIQLVLTFPAGFFAAFYFLKFRTILPLTAIHAICYPLLHNWVESHL